MVKGTTLIIGYFGLNNLGDDLMLKAYFDNLTSTKNHLILLQSENHYSFIPISKQIKCTGNIVNVLKIFLTLLKKEEIDEVIFLGGTQISDNSSIITRYVQLSILIISKLSGIETKILRGGVGSCRTFLTKQVLRRFDEIIVRDKTSLEKVTSLNIKASIQKDLVYDLKLIDKPAPRDRKIAITITGSVFKNNPIFLKRYLKILEYELQNENSVDFLIFQKKEDERFFDEIREITDIRHILSLNIQNHGEIARYNRIIGSRFHGMVLSNIYNVPVIGIGYDDKTKDFCTEYNYRYYDLNFSFSLE